MPRVKATIEYDGTDFRGWQIQPGCRTVQDVLQETASKRLDRKIKIHASGRTDTGVHATGQVVHFNTPKNTDLTLLKKSLNSMLPADIAVRSLEEVPITFHARFHAVSRTYRYEILLRSSALMTRNCWVYNGQLNAARMRRAIRSLLGSHDFKPFAKLNTKRPNYRCTIFDAQVKRHKDRISIQIRADRFVHGMVRALVGTLVDVGRGIKEESIFRDIIASNDRRHVSDLAPAQGLYLEKVRYRTIEDIKNLI
ncbi:tRNA pseudouridine(38-40) synthase TruA [candidate division KSB1 bacterium]